MAFATARRLPFQPAKRIQSQLEVGDAKRNGDALRGVPRGFPLVVLKKTQHLARNTGFLGELGERPSTPFAVAADDARQRVTFRHRQIPRFVPARFDSCFFIFHRPQSAQPGGTKAVQVSKITGVCI